MSRPDTFKVDAILTYVVAQTVYEAGLEWVKAGGDQIDCQALQHFDSSALAVLLSWQRAAQKAGRVVRVCNIPAGLASLAQAYGASALCFGE